MLVVVIVALGWLGVFNVQQQVPDRCAFPLGTITCLDARVSLVNGETRIVALTIRNDYSKTINVCELACTAEKQTPDGKVGGRLGLNVCTVDGNNIAPGEVRSIAFPSGGIRCYDSAGRSNAYGVGGRYSGKLYLTDFQLTGTSYYTKIIDGDLVATVQPA